MTIHWISNSMRLTASIMFTAQINQAFIPSKNVSENVSQCWQLAITSRLFRYSVQTRSIANTFSFNNITIKHRYCKNRRFLNADHITTHYTLRSHNQNCFPSNHYFVCLVSIGCLWRRPITIAELHLWR